MKPGKKSVEAEGRELVGMEEAIALLKTTRQTFYRWLRSGKIKGMKVGRQWRFYRDDIEHFLKGEGPRVELPGSLKPLLEALRKKLAETGYEGSLPAEGPEDILTVSLMILAASRLRASDLHLEATPRIGEPPCALLRYRIDGVLHTVAEFDLPLLKPLLERWKIMGNVNLHETKKPQDCRIQVNVQGAPLDIRAAFVPASLGEAMTARFLDRQAAILTLDRIPYAPRDREALLKALAAPWGLIAVTGPVGSGKTTALYAALQHCVSPRIKVMSVEDPVEYLLPGVTQIPVRVQEGVTFAAALRSILRSDPDVIMAGEVRDQETLQMILQTALTGHLVLTSLHTQNAASALRRLVDVGCDPFLVADALKLVLAQRLLRKVCADCAKTIRPEAAMLARARELAVAGGLGEPVGGSFRKAAGCAQCRQTGYRGRTVMAEVLVMTPELAEALRRGAPADQLQALAVKQGMTTMAADGVRRAAADETTLEEVFRMIPG